MKIQQTKNADYFTSVANECLAGREGAVVCINSQPCVWTGQLPTLNKAECKRRGLYVGQGRYMGGSIVNMPGDLSICITTWGKSELAKQIVDKASDWLSQRGIAISREENDVMADGKKVISWGRAMTREGWCQSVVHFSIGAMDLELVKAICIKPMVKEPGALSLYGITAEMCLHEVKDLIGGMEEAVSNG